MPIKSYKPTTAGRRGASVDAYADVTKHTPERRLIVTLQKNSGRNNQGKITVRHRGGGNRKKYRVIDFVGAILDIPGTVKAIEYDPNRNCRIALISYPNNEMRYVIAPEGIVVGTNIMTTSTKGEITVGNRMPIGTIPTGIVVHNIELAAGKGGEIVRSAGLGATIMAHEGGLTHLRLPSGEMRAVYDACKATIGTVSNSDFRNIRLGKAGRTRHRGFRPRVRGKAMNPVDHPHGGGEGNQPIGLKHPKTPWGKPALGVPTRRSHRRSNHLIFTRRKKR